MTLDLQTCSRARLSRDPRFDGKFFIGVIGSGVYCRSICPAPTAKEINCRYFPTAAAAAEAGFRPCLRCRPECSPGTPAWLGTSNTVSRALRLIGESGLEDGGIENLAERVGVGSRHLRRRFNAAIKKTYQRTPTQIRRLARQTELHPENEYVFHLRFRPPYHWNGMLSFLAARATPGVELVEQNCYRRSISINGCQGHFEISLNEDQHSLVVRVQIANPRSLFAIIERIRAMFDLNADWAAIAKSLGTDRQLAPSLRAEPGLRVPGCWSGFELTVRAILGQQITVNGATTLAGRIAKSFGQPLAKANGLTHLFPAPDVLADAKLTGVGLTEKRAQTIRSLARAVCDGQITFDRIHDSESFLQRLCEIPGIGSWTAQYVAMRALGEPDAFPAGDLGLLRALDLRNPRELDKRVEPWRPWRAYACMYLWTFAHKPQPRRTAIAG